MKDKKKEVMQEQEIDVSSLDAELAAAKAVEEGKNNIFMKVAGIVAILMTAFHVVTGFAGQMNYVSQRGFHLAFAISIVFLAMPLHEHLFGKKFADVKAVRIVGRIVDIALIVATWFAVFIARDEVAHISQRNGNVTQMAAVSGCILLIVVIEGARRALGWIMPIMAAIFLSYAIAGPYLPLAIAHRGYSWTRIFKFLATDLDGIFGTTMSVSATVIFMFVMFGAFLEMSGCSRFINDIAFSLTGKVRSGPALSAVIAAALMGMINGSAIANVVATGSFTIPLMKERGYKNEFSAGISAVASTGGQILPPVMGAGAFLMVAFTNNPYIVIIIAAAYPAILYFVGTAVAVISQSAKLNIQLSDPEDIPKVKDVVKDGWLYLVIIGVLLYCLLIAQLSPLRCALFATAAVPIAMLLDKKKRFTPKDIIPAFKKSGFSSMSVVMGCACAGIIVAMTSLTGIGVVFGDMMIKAAHGQLFFSLLFTAMACVILGMGLPTTSAYVIAASILAPSLVSLGLDMLTAHLFVFYFACLSAITPPVALAAYAAAGIAKCSPMTTGVEACKVGFAGFIVPFAFCYSEALMLRGDMATIILVCATALIGTVVISMGFQGWLIRNLNLIERLLLVVAGLLLFVPGTLTDIIGVGIAAAFLVLNLKYIGKSSGTAAA